MSNKSLPISIVKDIVLFGATQVAFYLAFKAILPLISPSSTTPSTSKSKQKQISTSLGFNLKELNLTEHEEIIFGQVVLVDELSVEFKDIGGLDEIVGQLREAIIFPLCYPKLFESQAGLFAAPKGVLLYGPPGCGKTMLAKVSFSHSSLVQFENCKN